MWSKRVPNFVIDTFYQRGFEGEQTHNPQLSYHIDNGQGLDSYLVGPTRGCGGTAVFADGKLIVSKNYTQLNILGSGPIRFAFQVTYAPWQAAGRTVTETKTISLDAGSHMSRIVSTYTFDGKSDLDLVAGLAVHPGADVQFPVKDSIASVWDTPQDPTADRIATGLVALSTEHAQTTSATDHALLRFRRHSGEPFTYYAGSGWSKADMPTQVSWSNYLTAFLNLRQHPVRRTWIQLPD